MGVAAAAYYSFGGDEGHGATPVPLAVGAPPTPTAPAAPRESTPLIEGEPTPAVPLSGVDAFHIHLRRPPRAGLVFDVDTGDVLWRERPTLVLPIASLTKIMTALLTVERSHPNDPVRITKAALNYSGSGVGLLPRGKRVRLETLLNGLLIVSGNDAAIALAVHLAGTERRFVGMMNRRAARLGARLHPLRLCARARGRQPLVRARPGHPDPPGDGGAAHPPDRPPPPGGRSTSRSRATSCTCTATTR